MLERMAQLFAAHRTAAVEVEACVSDIQNLERQLAEARENLAIAFAKEARARRAVVIGAQS